MIVTKHFSKRLKDRMGLSKKLSEQYFQKALEEGLYLDDFKDYNYFYNYLKALPYDKNYSLVIYNRYIIIYTKDNVAITLLNIPKCYCDIADNIKLKKEVKSDDKRTNTSVKNCN